MKKNSVLSYLAVVLLFITVLPSCKDEEPDPIFEEIVAVANRVSGDVSFVDATTNQVLETLAIANGEPMYVVYVPSKDKLYVGDRAQNRVHVIDPTTRTVETSITVGNGVFHMWADGQGNQLWVNNDIDETTSVIDLSNNTVVQTISLGSKPHDVFVNTGATQAYVSIFSSEASEPDSVFAFSTSTYERTHAQAVGKDPHLFHLGTSNKLFVPCQSGLLFTLNGTDLSEMTTTIIEGSHGIFASPNQNHVFVANISGGQLISVNVSDSSVQGSPLAAQEATPHNLTVNEAGDKLFVSHSGPTANKLSRYSISGGTLSADGIVTIGTNPFGLAYYKRRSN